MKKLNQQGSHVMAMAFAIVAIAAVGFVGWRVSSKTGKTGKTTTTKPLTSNITTKAKRVEWTYDNNVWKATSTPPKCSNPILDTSPVDMKTVTAILYPGQTRGQYKAHGGFHFRNNTTNDVTVKMPIDGYITSAVRYYQTGDNGVEELQYLVTFLNDCGISIKFDHLLTLSPEVQAIMNKQPAAKLNDTGSLPLANGPLFKKGAVVATAVGQKSDVSVGMDFGVYDYRQPNAASKDPAYAAAHAQASYQDFYATCWLNDLPPADAAIAFSLPGGDGKAGKTSDYCK